MEQALGGIRVLDLSSRLSGCWAARLMGDFGAEVILTNPHLTDESPFPGGQSLLYEYTNWNKHWSDIAASELIMNADIVITTCSRTELPPLPDGIIHLSITPHGLDGPWSGLAGNDLTHCARTGWAMINRLSGEAPLQLPTHQPGYIAGVAGFIGAIAALTRGGAECVDVSELEATALTCVPWAILGIFIGGDSLAYGPNRERKRDRPGPLWQAADGFINYGYGDWQQWQDALHFLEQHELAENPDYISPWGRHQKDPEPVRQALAAGSKARDKWALFHGLAERRCISGVVQNSEELATCDQLIARQFLVDLEIDGVSYTTTGPVGKFSGTPWKLNKPAPGQPTAKRFNEAQSKPVADKSHGQPLAGTRVLCFTQAWAGTFATEILALLGADVVQIETVKRPDVWRGAGAPVPPGVRNPEIRQNQLNTNGMYNSVNLNKRAITLDVTDPKGREMFWQMLPNFDVLVDNFSPHVMTNWGVTLETLREKRPDIIFASVSGYGRQGPLAEYPANGATTEPMAGFSSVHGYEGDEAMNTGGLIPDPISGYYLAASIVAAIHHRKRTGDGQRIDLAMIEAVSLQLGDAVLQYSATGEIRKPAGNTHPTIAPHGVFRCLDDNWLALAAEDDDAFNRLCRHINQDALAQDSRFTNMALRKQNETELNTILASWFATRDASDESQQLQALNLHAAVCEEFMPVYRDSNPQFDARRFMVPVAHPESGTHLMPVMPWVMHNTDEIETRYAPCFGEHSAEVFEQELNLTDKEYNDLVTRNVTGTYRAQ